jgi:translocation and assembly module TamB
MASTTSRPALRKALKWTARIVGGAVALVFVLVVAALLVVDLPWGRRFAARELNAILAPMFKGKIVVDHIGSLMVSGVGDVDAHIDAADGTRVLVARGASARIVPIALVESLLRTSHDLDIDVFDVNVDSVEVNVDTDNAGALKLVGAFDPAQPTTPPSPDAPSARGLHLGFPHATVGHTWVHGHMKGAPPVDADLDEVVAAVDVPAKGMMLDLSHALLVTRGMPQGANVLASLKAHFAMPSATGADMAVTGAFDGTIGGIPTTAQGALDGNRLDAVLDVPAFAAERLKALVPQAPVEKPVAVHVEAHGPLEAVQATLHARVGDSILDGVGDAQVTGKLTATLHLDAKNIDARAFSETAPASIVALQSTVHVNTKSDGMVGGDFTVDAPPGTAAGQAIPAASFKGTFDQTSRGFGGDMAGSIAEPGAPIAVKASFDAEGVAPVLGFDVSTKIDRLADVKRVHGLGPGSAALRATGTVTLATPPSVDATVQVAAFHLEQPSVHIDATRLEGHAYGPLGDPRLEATVEATGLHAAGYTFRDAHIAVEGSLERENVMATLLGDQTSNIRLSSSVVVGPAIALQGTTVDVWRGKQSLHASIGRVDAGGGRIDVLGAVITGVGETTRATVHLFPDSIVVQSDSNGIDLERLGYVLGLDKTLRKGSVKYAVDLAVRRDGLQGTTVFDLTNACFGRIDGLTGHVDARMENRTVTASIQLSADGVGSLHAEPVRIELGGQGGLEGASWRRASGEVRLDGEVDLARLIALLPPNTVPVGKVSGKLAIKGDVSRSAESDALPDITLQVKTTGLEIAPQRRPDIVKNGVVLVAQPEKGASGIDVHATVEAYGKRGAGKFGLRLVDKHGTIVAADAWSDAIPFKSLMAANARMMQELMQVPFTAKVVVPARQLAQFPDALRDGGLTGTAEATLSIEGTGLAPKVAFDAKGHNIRFDSARKAAPLEGDLNATYDGTKADVIVTVKDATRQLLEATGRLNANAGALIQNGAGAPWTAAADGTLDHFPLEAVPMLSDRRMHGTVDGGFALTDLHKDARVSLDIATANLRVGKQKYGGGKVHVGYDGKALSADLRLTQDAGFANANAKVPLHWGADVAPSRDPTGAIEAAFTAKKFRVGFLAPFVQAVFDSFDGTLDADAHVSLVPNQKPSISGSVALTDGVVGIPQLGQDLHGVKGRVVLNQDGTVRLDGAEAHGTVGKVTASGTAKLDGTDLVNAQLTANIEKRDAIPLDAQGTDLGSVYGKFNVNVATGADRKSMTVAVDIPSVHVTLPDASTHSVQALGELPDSNHIGVFTTPERFTAVPLDGHEAGPTDDGAPPSMLTIGITIGDAQIARGTDVRVGLGGKLTAKLEKKTAVTGQIQLKTGKLDVQGKSFEIESGTVTFTGDPSNPDVKVTAGWTAEDGTRVYADYTGPLQTGKVTLRSEPARPQNEIVALILFGTADGSESTPYASPDNGESTGEQAGATAGGFATGGLSKGLNKLTGLDITAKIDTSQANPRPEVEVQIARNISLELAVVLGTPPPGTNQDTTYATIDWRFLRSWSLETTFGDLGASIADVVWRHRY